MFNFLHIEGEMICTTPKLHGELKNTGASIEGALICEDMAFSGLLTLGGELLPYYTDSYVVTPKKYEQSLDTDYKSMTDDVTVKAIPFSEVSNPEGGKTIIIGGEL